MIDKLAQHFGVEVGQIVDHKVYGDDTVCLVDYGIKGVKKFTVAIDKLPEPELTPEPSTPNRRTRRKVAK